MPPSGQFWARFVDALAAVGYDGPLSIENEDYTLGQRESVALAVRTLRDPLNDPRPVGLIHEYVLTIPPGFSYAIHDG